MKGGGQIHRWKTGKILELEVQWLKLHDLLGGLLQVEVLGTLCHLLYLLFSSVTWGKGES